MASFDTYACSVGSKSFGESHHRCSQHVNAGTQSGPGPCRLKGAFVKRVPVILGRNDRNVGGRRQNVDDIDSEADQPANLLPADSDSNNACGGGDSDSKSDSGPVSGYISMHIHVLINYISLDIHTYQCTYRMYLSDTILKYTNISMYLWANPPG